MVSTGYSWSSIVESSLSSSSSSFRRLDVALSWILNRWSIFVSSLEVYAPDVKKDACWGLAAFCAFEVRDDLAEATSMSQSNATEKLSASH